MKLYNIIIIKKYFMINRLIKIIFLFVILFQSSCGMKKRWDETGKYTIDDSLANTYVWKKGKQYIAIVQSIPVSGRNLNKTIHPIRISPETIERSFSKIKYKIEKKGKLIPVFNDRNLELLSEKIPEAISKTKRNQDILFEIYQLKKKWKFLPTTILTTAGYIFVEPRRINIIFEKINEDYQGYDYDEPRILVGDASQGVYGSRINISKGWVILTQESWN